MALSDIVYYGDRGYRLSVEFRADDGTWVDFNAQFPSTVPDYWRGLLREPSIAVRSEDATGIYAPSVDSLVMDNSPWQGNKYGVWDAYTPLTIRGKTFTQWMRRRVRLVLELYVAGELTSSTTLATCLVESITRRGGVATVKLSSVARLLQTRSAETLKIGSDWARGWPIASLIRMVVQRTDPTIEFSTGFGATLTDLGTFSVARCSSWGSVPGILSTGMPAADHWIPRCFCSDPNVASYLWVGFECPGSNDVSDGAIGMLDLATGKWVIYHKPAALPGQFPIAIWKESGFLYIFTVADFDPGTAITFYEVRYYRSILSGLGSPLEQHDGYWPARETLRRGVPTDTGDRTAHIGALGTLRYGESAMCPFPQVIAALDRELTGAYGGGDVEMQSYRQGDYCYARYTHLSTSAISARIAGAYGASYTHNDHSLVDAIALRHFMGLQWHQPYRALRGANTYVQYVRLWPNTYNYYLMIYPKNGGSFSSRSFVNVLGSSGSQLWYRQITAWAADPHSTSASTDERIIIATIEWDETGASPSRLWSPTRLIACRFPGSDAAVTTSLTIDDPADGSAPNFARVIVALWTPPKGEPLVEPAAETADYCVGVAFNRASIQTPAYGLGIWKRATDTTLTQITLFGSSGYTGPTSSMPFGGFVRDAADEQTFRFVDQATGQVWRCTLDASLTTATWSLENKGQAAHGTEFALATVNGGQATLDLETVYLWGMAPGPTGEVTAGYPLRDGAKPSWIRRVPGLYPLVQLSKKVADAVEVADFSGLKAWDVLKLLKQLAYNHRLYFDGNGKLHFEERAVGTSAGHLRPVDMEGYVAFTGTGVPVEAGFEVCEGIGQVKNAVDVTPWGLVSAGQADKSTISAAGSTWAGDYLYEVKTERPARLAITCVQGGDVWAAQATASAGRCAVLFRWQTLAETLHHYLAVLCGATDTHVRVAGLTVRSSSEIYSGEIRIRTGDLLQVADGTQREITGVLATAEDYVDLSLSGAVDVSASAYSEVSITPQDSALASDAEAGLTTLAAEYTSGTTLSVVDASQINVDSVVRVRSSYFHVTAKTYVSATCTDLTVTLLHMTAIPDTSLPVGSPVRVYIYIAEVSKTYPVGATGITFGVAVNQNTVDTKDRSISAGDGLAISAPGLHLSPLKQATIRAMNKESIGDQIQGTGYGRQDLSISDNRFIDPVKADLLSQMVLSEAAWPRTLASGIVIAILPSITGGGPVTSQDPRISRPTSAGAEQSASFEVTEVRYDLAHGKQSLALRGFTPISSRSRATDSETAGHGAQRVQAGNRE